jgi:ribosome-binding ATPase YchF (GTP1/OBG family)
LLADLGSVERRLERVGRAAKGGDVRLQTEVAELERLRDHLSDGSPARVYPATEALAEAMSTLITAKPTLYVANVDEDSVAEGNRYSSQVEKHSSSEGAEVVRICAKLEAEVAELPDDEAAEYLAMLGVKTTGFEEFVRAAYRLLGLVTFFTAKEKEARAWTVREGSTVRQAAGRIHTDMERGFIGAEVGDWRDIVAAGSWTRAKEEAKVRLEGRDYVVRDGDTVLVPTTANDLTWTHAYYRPDEGSDLDAVFPLETLRRLVRDGIVGGLSTRHFSFMGAIHDSTPLVESMAPEVADKLVEDQVDIVLLTPS